MNVALVARTFGGTQGGTERVLLGFSRWLVAAGHGVTVFCERSADVPAAVRVEALKVWGHGRTLRALALYRATQQIPAAAFDCVIGFGRTASHRVYRAGGGCHAAWLEARGGWRPADPVDLWLDRQAIASARIVIANSRMAERDLVHHYGVAPAKVCVVHNGVDLGRFRPRQRSGRFAGPTVGFLGTGFHRKGLETAIRAVARIGGARLVVMGHDAHPRRYQALAEGLGIASRFQLLGPQEAPESLLPELDALVLPTRYDSFANATLEGLASGVPVITSARNGGAEVLPESWMTVADPADHLGFAHALEQALHLQSQGDGLSTRCRQAAESFPAEQMFQKFLDVIVQSTEEAGV